MKIEFTFFEYFICKMIQHKTMASVITMAFCGLVVAMFGSFSVITSMEVIGACIICALAFCMMVFCHVTDIHDYVRELVNEKVGF